MAATQVTGKDKSKAPDLHLRQTAAFTRHFASPSLAIVDHAGSGGPLIGVDGVEVGASTVACGRFDWIAFNVFRCTLFPTIGNSNACSLPDNFQPLSWPLPALPPKDKAFSSASNLVDLGVGATGMTVPLLAPLLLAAPPLLLLIVTNTIGDL